MQIRLWCAEHKVACRLEDDADITFVGDDKRQDEDGWLPLDGSYMWCESSDDQACSSSWRWQVEVINKAK